MEFDNFWKTKTNLGPHTVCVREMQSHFWHEYTLCVFLQDDEELGAVVVTDRW